MFNADQMGHMASLNAIPAEAKCWCGWWTKADCHACREFTAAGLTCADKIKERCQDCKAAPHRPGGKITHRIGCRSSMQTHVKEQ